MNELIRAPEHQLQVITGELVASNAETELYLITDLSGSMRGRLFLLVAMLSSRLKKIAAAGVRWLSMHVFSNTCTAWPNGTWSVPQSIEVFPHPTQSDFARIHGGDTALVDALRQVVQIAMSRKPAKSRVVLLTDGKENQSRCWKHASREQKDAIRDEMKAAQAAGVFIGIVGFANRSEQIALYVLCEELGIPANNVMIFEHQGDEASVSQSMDSAGDSMADFSSRFVRPEDLP